MYGDEDVSHLHISTEERDEEHILPIPPKARSLGTLYRVDPDTGEATEIDLGGESVTNGDGILLQGKTLFVVRNQLNQIAEIQLSPDLSSGTLIDTITDDSFDVPTTLALFGNRLYAVNARFNTPPTPTTEYSIVQVKR